MMEPLVQSDAVLDGSMTSSNISHGLGAASPQAHMTDAHLQLFKKFIDSNYKNHHGRHCLNQKNHFFFRLTKPLPRSDYTEVDTGGLGKVKAKESNESGVYDQRYDYLWTILVEQRPPELPARKRSMLIAQQEWEGYVVAIEEDVLVARLTDLTAGSEYESEEASIPLDEISDSDKEKMDIGSIFRWVIGHEYSPTGGKKSVSEIIFRDLPGMTEADIERGEEWANEVASVLGK